MSMPRLLSFFTGIGGFDLAFEELGVKPALHCEINPFCRSVLERHWPDVMRANDIVRLRAEDLPAGEIWCGGFPCQDVSVARGSRGRDGIQGSRSGLFFALADLMAARRPRAVLIENVTGLLNSNKGRDFRVVLDTLLGMGYGVAWRVVNTRYFGAPQSRPRVYICAVLGDPEAAAGTLFEVEGSPRPTKERLGFVTPDVDPGSRAIVPDVAFCLAATSGRHTGTDWSRSYVTYSDRVRRMTPRDCDGLQGFARDWTLPADTWGLPPEKIDTLRYTALGNAVSVPVVRWIAERLLSRLEARRQAEPFATPSSWVLSAAAPALGGKDAETLELPPLEDHELAPAYKWRSGGVASAGAGVHARMSTSPRQPIASSFGDLIEQGPVHERYYLSPNAAKGILRRVDSQNRSLFPPLRRTLERMVATIEALHPVLGVKMEPEHLTLPDSLGPGIVTPAERDAGCPRSL